MKCFLSIVIACSLSTLVGATPLPQDHEYQKELRKFMGTLTAKDFEPVDKSPTVVKVKDDDAHYEMWLLTLEVPRVGRKRSYPSVNLPSEQFTLSYIEGSTNGVIRPSCWPEPTTWLANWNYEGNPYHGSKALKLRAFVVAALDMMMTDGLQEHSDAPSHKRADWFGPHLSMYAYTYAGVRDALPKEARAAYETGLKKLIKRVNGWGPKGEETHFDLAATLGMGIAAKTLQDPEISKIAEDYTKRLLNDERFYHPAGYFVDAGCFDAGFNGLSLYFGTWLATATDWPFAKEAVAKAWRLKSYLYLPEPDGEFLGPTHMNSRTSSDCVRDQWNWPFVAPAAALLTDDAISMAKFPAPEELPSATTAVVGELIAQLKENPGYKPSSQLVSSAWAWRLWPDSGQFPTANFAYDNYTKGHYAHRLDLVKKNSPLVTLPFQREGTFIESFEKAFVIAKMPTFGVVIHTGPVSEFKEGFAEYNGPYGLGGGCLSAFWTPSTGSALLGRRAGMRINGPTPVTFDKVAEWRTWPIHALSGATAAGKFFTSARIQRPETTYDIRKDKADIRVSGVIPAVTIGKEKVLDGRIEYARTFHLDDKGLRVETTVKGDGADKVVELYETLPVFLRETKDQAKATPTKIEFQAGDKWAEATSEIQEKVHAIKLTRFDGTVMIIFDQPQRVKLSPNDWTDTYLSRASCRNVLIDFLPSGNADAVSKGVSVSYTIGAVKK
jgi:hypothetical protein